MILQMAAMCDVSATETAIIYSLDPVWGGSFAWFMLGERWGPSGWIGAALVLGKLRKNLQSELSYLSFCSWLRTHTDQIFFHFPYMLANNAFE